MTSDIINVRARLRLLTEAEGGHRKRRIISGYKPDHVFEYTEGARITAYIGQIELPEGLSIEPGEEKEVIVRFLNISGKIRAYLTAGRKWRIHEGRYLVASGEIIALL